MLDGNATMPDLCPRLETNKRFCRFYKREPTEELSQPVLSNIFAASHIQHLEPLAVVHDVADTTFAHFDTSREVNALQQRAAGAQHAQSTVRYF